MRKILCSYLFLVSIYGRPLNIRGVYEMYTYCDKLMQLGIITVSVQFSSNIF